MKTSLTGILSNDDVLLDSDTILQLTKDLLEDHSNLADQVNDGVKLNRGKKSTSLKVNPSSRKDFVPLDTLIQLVVFALNSSCCVISTQSFSSAKGRASDNRDDNLVDMVEILALLYRLHANSSMEEEIKKKTEFGCLTMKSTLVPILRLFVQCYENTSLWNRVSVPTPQALLYLLDEIGHQVGLLSSPSANKSRSADLLVISRQLMKLYHRVVVRDNKALYQEASSRIMSKWSTFLGSLCDHYRTRAEDGFIIMTMDDYQMYGLRMMNSIVNILISCFEKIVSSSPGHSQSALEKMIGNEMLVFVPATPTCSSFGTLAQHFLSMADKLLTDGSAMIKGVSCLITGSLKLIELSKEVNATHAMNHALLLKKSLYLLCDHDFSIHIGTLKQLLRMFFELKLLDIEKNKETDEYILSMIDACLPTKCEIASSAAPKHLNSPHLSTVHARLVTLKSVVHFLNAWIKLAESSDILWTRLESILQIICAGINEENLNWIPMQDQIRFAKLCRTYLIKIEVMTI